MIAYLIAALAIALVLGSVLWLKPSAQQQRQVQMRLLARQLGLDVRLCNLPQNRRARVRQDRPELGVVYRLPIFERREPPLPEYLLCRENSAAPWEAEATPELPPALRALVDKVCAELPADAVALEFGPQGPAVYWRERGDEQTLRRLGELLVELRAALLADQP